MIAFEPKRNISSFSTEMKSIAVIGAGVIGVTTAIQIQKDVSNVSVTIITAKLSPDTTGDVSAGLWGPYLLGDTPSIDIM